MLVSSDCSSRKTIFYQVANSLNEICGKNRRANKMPLVFLASFWDLKPREEQETPVIHWGVGAGVGHVETPFPSSV